MDRVQYDSSQTVSRSDWNRNTTTDSVVGDLHQSITFVNERIRAQLVIDKRCSTTGNPLGQAMFRVERITDIGIRLVGEFITNAEGRILLDNIEPGRYRVTEVSPPPGFIVDRAVHEATIAPGQRYELIITNTPRSPILIRKVDPQGNPLLGAEFTVTTMNGQHVATVQSAHTGYAIVPNVQPGWFVVQEVRAPQGHILSNTPQTVEVFAGRPALVTFVNHPYPILHIAKLDADGGSPLLGATFRITEANGRFVGEHTTGPDGLITITDLPPGVYIVTEIRSPDGYILDMTPQTVELRAGHTSRLEFRNTAYANLSLRKICSESREPLPDAVFRLFDDRRREIGTFTTNAAGEIFLADKPAGVYFLQEVRSPAGYLLDTTVRQIELISGHTTNIEWPNTPLGSLRIVKVDADTRQPLYNVEFELLDARNNILGRFTTDRHGLIVFTRNLAPERYYLRETRAAEGYLLDERRHPITIVPGQTTEVVIENRLMVGNIQIVKLAAQANPITGDRAGAALAGAVFEIVNERLEVVDTITTDNRGIAVSRDLPLGRYALREITSPEFYLICGGVFYADIRVHGDLVRFEVLNHPADINVTIDKRGNVEALAGDVIRYDFTNIANESNISLDDFFWRDQLPSELRLERIVTGTWSDRLRYRVVYATNLRREYRVWQGDMLSTVNHTLEVADLNLAANEFVTSFRFEFGTVPAGFREVQVPHIFARVVDNLPHEHRIVNSVEVGGRVGNDFVYNVSSWLTVVFRTPRGALPRTGLV